MPLIAALQSIAAADAVGVGTFDAVGLAHSATLSGDLVVTVKHPMILKIDPGGATRDLTFEAEAGCPGRVRWIVNAADAGGENLLVKNDAGATIATINQNESAVVYCDGTAWSLIAVVAIALS
jgi:hypothetical protein